MRKVILLALLFLAAPAFGQVTHPPTMSSASLPACNISRDGTWVSLVDASTTLDCDATGGGSVTATCKCEQQSAGVFAWVGVSTGAHTVDTDTDTDDQTAAEVPITDAGTFYTTDTVEAALQQIGPTMTDARTPTTHAHGPVPSATSYVATWADTTGTELGNSILRTTNDDIDSPTDYGFDARFTLGSSRPYDGSPQIFAPCMVRFPSQFYTNYTAFAVENCGDDDVPGNARGEMLAVHFADEAGQPPTFDLTSDDGGEDGVGGGGLLLAGYLDTFGGNLAYRRIAWSDTDSIPSLGNAVGYNVGIARCGDGKLCINDGSRDVDLLRDLDARTVTAAFVGNVTGNADTATALAADPADCDPGEFVTGIAADGTPVCDTPAGGSSSNSFETISTTSGTAPVADAPTDTLTLTAGSGITITGDSATDTVTIAATGGGGTPGGADTQVQYNDAGSFGGDSGLVFNETTDALTVGGRVYALRNAGVSTPAFSFTAATTYGLNQAGTSTLLVAAGENVTSLTSSVLSLSANHFLVWNSTNNDSDGSVGAVGLKKVSDSVLGVSSGASGDDSFQALRYISVVQAFSIADDGAGTKAAGTLTPTSSYVECSCLDTHGCDVTMSETGALQGQSLTIVNIGTNACDFADAAGVSELPAGGVSLGINDSLGLIYASDRWIATSRSDN